MSKAVGAAWEVATTKLMVCADCLMEFVRTGRRQLVCQACAVLRHAKRVYKHRVTSGSIRQPGVGVGGGQGSGPMHHSWTTGSGGYRRFGPNACERCGSTKFLCRHHKDHNRRNNAPENIEVVCKSCHQKEHNAAHHLNDKKGKVVATGLPKQRKKMKVAA